MAISSQDPCATNNCDGDVDVLAVVGEHLELVPGAPGVVVLVLGHRSGDIKHHVLVIKNLLEGIVMVKNMISSPEVED